MRTDIVVTEYGRPASSELARAIVAAKAGQALAPVSVIVPSNFAGLAARRMLGSGDLGVGGVANVNFLTPFRLAELLSVGRLNDRRPLTNPVLGAAVRRALADDPRHFRSVRDHQATERALAAAVGELSNVSAAGLQAIEHEGGHSAGVVSLYRSIAEHLRGFHGEADVARAAAHRPDLAAAIGSYGHLVWFLPGPVSAPLAGFLRAAITVAPTTVIVASTGDDEADAEVHRTLRIAGVAPPDAGADADDRQTGFEPPLADHVISVTDADEEVRAVIREIVQLINQGTAPDRIGIFHPVPDPYVRILEQQFAAAGIPANGPSRRRLGESVAGRVLTAALALPGERWRRDRVIALVNSGPLRHAGQSARPAVWDGVSRRAGVVAGLPDWRSKLDFERRRTRDEHDHAMAGGRSDRAEQLSRHGGDIDDLASFVDSLAELVDAVQSATGWKQRAAAAVVLLRELLGGLPAHRWWPEAEQAAFESVEAALERLALLDDIDPEPTMAVFARALATELSVARERNGRFGHGVVYGPLASAPGHDLDAVFILGCTEGVCPAPRREDVLLPDRARRLTRGDLPERLGQIEEQHRLFLAALAAAPPGKRWLFLPRGDLRSSRRSRPSRWLLPSASRLAGRSLYATDFEHTSPAAVHEVASHASALLEASHYTSVDERDVARVFAHVLAGGEASAHPAASLAERGLAAQAARRSHAFTRFDGNLAGVPVRADAETAMSASRLETWAACGFRYYLGHVLGLAQRDDPDRTIELSPLDRGSGVHEVLERFMREVVEAGPPAPHEPWSDQHRARAQQIVHEVFDDYERRGRTGRRIIWETQKSDLLALVDEFLTADDAHRAANGATPAMFELPFGMRGADPLAIELDDGRTLRFRGMIDRIDHTPVGAAFVSDYKTGKGSGYADLDKGDPTKAGTLLQLGLYAEAVAQHLGARSVDTAYWMVNTQAGHKRRGYPWNHARRSRLVEVLTTIADGIESGVFMAVPGDWQSFRSTFEQCAYCDFDSICPRGRSDQASDKAAAPELEVRRRLAVLPEPDGEPVAPA